MKQGKVEVIVVLDRSGSMDSIKSDTIGGFNTFLNDQKTNGAETFITLVQFDDLYKLNYEAIAVTDAPELTVKTFVPRGRTALLDAIGKTINTTGERFAKMDESERPEKVVFVIITDGEENASEEFKKPQINKMITHQRDAYKWEFVFLAANQDAIATGTDLGMLRRSTMTYEASAKGTTSAFAALSKNTKSYAGGQSISMDFGDAQRKSAV